MTLKQLEYFLAIARTGHITAAARELNISQPPLSAQLRLLEDELKTQLFRRDKHNLLITPAGEALRDRAVQILALTDAAAREVQQLGDIQRGSVHVGAVTSVCHHILPDCAAAFLRRFPGADFQLWEGSSMRIMELLGSGIIELGIIREPFDHALYEVHPFREDMLRLGKRQQDPFVAIGPEPMLGSLPDNEALPLCALADFPLILHRRYHDLLVGAFRQAGVVPNILCENDDLVSSLGWAAAGLGVAIVPLTSSRTPLVGGNLVSRPIQAPAVDARLAVITRRGDALSPFTRSFLEMLTGML